MRLLESRHEMTPEWGHGSSGCARTSDVKSPLSPPSLPLILARRTPGGKDCIYHLSGLGRAELRGAGQHKIIIHKHEITKSLGTEQQNYFISEGGHSIF